MEIFIDSFCFPCAFLSLSHKQDKLTFRFQLRKSLKVKKVKIKEEDDHHHANNRIDNIILISSGPWTCY